MRVTLRTLMSSCSPSPLTHPPQDLQNCYYLCEDVQFINFTSSKMTTDKAAILTRFFYTPDAKEYGLLMEDLVMNNLQCRHQCWVDVDAINDTFYHNTLTNILNYLQFCYYQGGSYSMPHPLTPHATPTPHTMTHLLHMPCHTYSSHTLNHTPNHTQPHPNRTQLHPNRTQLHPNHTQPHPNHSPLSGS